MSYSMFTLGEVEVLEYAAYDPDFYKKSGQTPQVGYKGATVSSPSAPEAVKARSSGKAKSGVGRAARVVWVTSKRGIRYARRVAGSVTGAIGSGAGAAMKHVGAHGGKYAIGAGALAAGAAAAGYLASRKRESQYSRRYNLAEFGSKKSRSKEDRSPGNRLHWRQN